MGAGDRLLLPHDTEGLRLYHPLRADREKVGRYIVARDSDSRNPMCRNEVVRGACLTERREAQNEQCRESHP